jgi:Amt family ammonium transporter
MGNIAQFFNQCIGVGIVFGCGTVASFVILIVVRIFVGLRVPEETEREGDR